MIHESINNLLECKRTEIVTERFLDKFFKKKKKETNIKVAVKKEVPEELKEFPEKILEIIENEYNSHKSIWNKKLAVATKNAIERLNADGFDYSDDEIESTEFDISAEWGLAGGIEYDKYSGKFIWCCNIISADQLIGLILEENGNIISQFISAIKPNISKICEDKLLDIKAQDGDAPGYIIVYFK